MKYIETYKELHVIFNIVNYISLYLKTIPKN